MKQENSRGALVYLLFKKNKLCLAFFCLYGIFVLAVSFWITAHTVAFLGIGLITPASLYWGLNGGMLSSIWMSAVLGAMFFHSPSSISMWNFMTTVVIYFLIAVGYGKSIDIIRRQKLMLKESEEQYRSFVENAIEAIFLIQDDTIKYANPKTEQMTGYSANDLYSLPYENFVYPDDRGYVKGCYIDKLKGKSNKGYIRFRIITKKGELKWCELNGVNIKWDNKPAVLCFAADITDRKEAEDLSKELMVRLDQIIESLPDATFVIDNKGRVIAWNKAIEEMTGVNKKDILGKGNYEYALPFYGERRPMLIDLALFSDKEFSKWEKEYDVMRQNGNSIYVEAFAPSVYGGKGAYLWATASKLCDSSGRVIGAVESIRDITARKKAEEKIKYLSFHDSLTGLYNRYFLEEEMKRLDTPRQLPISIIMADLNNLKLVNDTYGHSTGDEMLSSAAETLKESCRKEDIVARWGGDEFVVLLPQTAENEVYGVCKRISQESSKRKINGLPLSIAVGFAVKKGSKEDIFKTLQQAEAHMYQDKLAKKEEAKRAVLDVMLKSLEEKNYETKEHIRHRQQIAVKIGKKIGLPEEELERLKTLIMLYDIGKINIPEEILKKNGSLTEKEMEVIKKHPETGYRIASSIDEFANLAENILSHHEHWDGSGYPRGLKGREIPVLARITAIVDSYNAMITGRPYKKAISPKEAAAEIKRNAGIQFDPELVKVFLRVISDDLK
ncbi:MAG: PAS domain S-box protein [Firmicutes bacterium]|nr:PAS domain S-box protein [Bacillota bacterium]